MLAVAAEGFLRRGKTPDESELTAKMLAPRRSWKRPTSGWSSSWTPSSKSAWCNRSLMLTMSDGSVARMEGLAGSRSSARRAQDTREARISDSAAGPNEARRPIAPWREGSWEMVSAAAGCGSLALQWMCKSGSNRGPIALRPWERRTAGRDGRCGSATGVLECTRARTWRGTGSVTGVLRRAHDGRNLERYKYGVRWSRRGVGRKWRSGSRRSPGRTSTLGVVLRVAMGLVAAGLRAKVPAPLAGASGLRVGAALAEVEREAEASPLLRALRQDVRMPGGAEDVVNVHLLGRGSGVLDGAVLVLDGGGLRAGLLRASSRGRRAVLLASLRPGVRCTLDWRCASGKMCEECVDCGVEHGRGEGDADGKRALRGPSEPAGAHVALDLLHDLEIGGADLLQGDPSVIRRRLAVELVPTELDELLVVREGAEGDHVPRDASAVEELICLHQAVGHGGLGH